jgi:hypothetical protein
MCEWQRQARVYDRTHCWTASIRCANFVPVPDGGEVDYPVSETDSARGQAL